MTDGDDTNILSEPTPSEADDLISTNVPSEGDDLLAEQTWPTEDEIASAPANTNGNGIHRTFGTELMPPPALPGTTPRRLRKVPKGTSAYQAAWIPDEDDEYDDDFGDENDDDDDDAMQDGNGQYEREPPLLQDSDEEYEEVDPAGPEDQIRGAPSSVTGQTSTGFGAESYQDLPMDIERSQYEAYQAQKKRDNLEMQRENKDDLEFPDEVDTPLDIPARERFARYRGLKSFRTSAWDPYENLPRDYARCFMFQDYKIMGKKLERRAREDGVEVSLYSDHWINDCID
jgi:pre-rRNA-processing protein TSR1